MSNPHAAIARLPPLQALRGFEACVRTGSFTAAASELLVTQGAISRQVRQLEEHLGTRLLVRSRAGLALTPAGDAWLAELRPILRQLERAAARARARGAGGVLNLSVPASLGMGWLLPRLPRFLARHPGTTVNLSTRVGPLAPHDRPVDAAILYAEAPPLGWECRPFLHLDLFPVAAPGVVAGGEVAGLEAAMLLGQSTLPDAWLAFFRLAGLDPARMRAGPMLDLLGMGVAAAEAGLGAALAPAFAAAPALRRGALRRVGRRVLRARGCYWLCFAPGAAPPGPLLAFARWLEGEGAADPG